MRKKLWLTGLLSVMFILFMCLTACETEVEKIVYRDRYPDPPGTIDIAVLEPGTYYGWGTGWHGRLRATVVLSESAIESITLGTNLASFNPESTNIGRPGATATRNRILAQQSTVVDVTAGATYSSMAVMAAVRDAITQAGGTDRMLSYDCRTSPVTIRGRVEDFNPDVIVVGGGLGGITAALCVADYGGRSLLVEQAPHIGGSSRFVAGAFSGAELIGQPTTAGSTVATNFSNITIPAYTNFLETWHDALPGGGYRRDVSEAYVANIPNGMQKLLDFGMGQPTITALAGSEDFTGLRTCATYTRQGQLLFDELQTGINKFVISGNFGYILNSKVVDLIMDGNNVAGVKLEDGREIRAKAVILATGGYSCNEDILSIPEPKGPGIKYWTISSSQTDIGNMTKVMMDPPYNAKTYRLDLTRWDGGVIPMVPKGYPYRLKFSGAQTVWAVGNASGSTARRLFFNKDGNRYTDETIGAGSTAHSATDFERWNAGRQAPDQLSWVLGVGARIQLQDGELGPTEPTATNELGRRAWWDDLVEKGVYLWEFDPDLPTLEAQVRDLATRGGINPDNVWNAVKTYNEDLTDPAFGNVCGLPMDPTSPTAAANQIMWLVKTSGHIKGTLGGLDLSPKAEVENANGPIGGLYAAGEIGGNIAYTSFLWLVGYNTSVEASFGEISARNALAWAKSH